MFPRFAPKSFGLVVLATALTASFASIAIAQSPEVDAVGARALVTGKIDDSRLVRLKGLAPGAAENLEDLGPVAPDQWIDGQLLLKRAPEAEEALRLFEQKTRTPGDAMYGQTLTPKEFSSAFGAAQADIVAITAWLESHGLEVSATSSGKLSINFSGPAAQAEETFHTAIHSYKTAEGVVCYAPASDVQLPAALANAVDHPTGLDNFGASHTAGFDGPVVDASSRTRLTQSKPGTFIPDAQHIHISETLGDTLANARPDLLTPTMAVTLGTSTLAFAADGSTLITATLTYTGSTAPTGTVYFYDADGVLTTSMNLTSCTPGTQTLACAYTFTGAAAEPTATATLYATYTGDSNFNAATGSANLTITIMSLARTPTVTVTATPASEIEGAFSAVTIKATITGVVAKNPTGSFEVVGSNGLGELAFSSGLAVDSAHCVLVAPTYTCTYTWTPAAALPSAYTIFGAYSGGSTYSSAFSTAVFTVNPSGTATTGTSMAANPPGVSSTAKGTTLTTITSWLSGTQPTGNLAITASAGLAAGLYYPTVLGYVTFPALGSTTTSGAGSFNDTSALGPYTSTWSCTASTSANTVTCNIAEADLFDPLAQGSATLTASYSGDTNFAASSGTAAVANPAGTFGLSTFTVVPAPASVTYETPTAVTYTVTINGTAGHGGAPTGTFTISGTPIGSVPVQITINSTDCTITAAKNVCGFVATVPAATAVGSYTVTVNYSGDANYATNSTTSSVAVAGATPMVAITPSPATAVYGSTTGIPLTVTVTGSTGGTAPTAVPSMSAPTGAFGAVSCSSSGIVETCSVTYTPSGTLGFGTHAAYITATVVAGGNYVGASGTDDLQVSRALPTVTITPNPAVEVYGTVTGVPLTVTVHGTGVAGDTTPIGAVTMSAATGTFTTPSCSSITVNETCTTTWTPAGTETFGTHTGYFTASAAAGGNYLAATGMSNLNVTQSSAVTATMSSPKGGGANAEVDVYGELVSFAVSGKLAWTGSGVAPAAGDIAFTSSTGAAGTFTGTSCVLTGGVSPYTCTATFNPTATDAVGSYGINLALSGDTNYANTVSAQTQNYQIGQQAPAPLFVSPRDGAPQSEVYGSLSAFTVHARLAWMGSATPPTVGNISFTSTAGAGTFGSVTCTGVPTPYSCTATFTPTATDAVGSYALNLAFAADTNYSAAATIQAANFVVTQATTAVALVAATTQGGSTPCGTTTTGITACVLTATMSPAISGATVTFTDTTTGQTIGTGTTTAGVAAISLTTATTGIAGGVNNFTATVTGTTNYTSATSAAGPVAYFQGILFSTVGAHNFSGLITDGSQTVEGTLDGTQLGPYSVGVYNFTTTAQPLPLTLTNSTSKAFSVTNQCANPLPAGGACSFNFYYAPPAGDGCNANLPPTGGGCTLDGSNFPQGTFESAPWSVAVSAGVLTGIGNQGFTRSGAASPSGTLEGKAILAPGVLNVSPLTAAFGSAAQNATSQTITIVVSNTSGAAVPFTYTAPTSGDFTVDNTCNAGTSGTLAANASCDIYLTMVTTNIGSFSDSLTITPSGGTPSTVAISGTVAAANTGITLSSNQHNFGNITDGTSVSVSVTLTNNTSGAASLGFSNAIGTGYTTSSTCGASLAASASCVYGFTFAPTAPGASTDTLTITSNVPILPGNGSDIGTVTVNGTGVAGGHLTATSVTHNFGSIAVGTSGGNYGVEITNSTSSTVTMSFSGLTNTGAGFSLVGSTCGASLAVNANCELQFSFTPTATGFVTGKYPITSSSPLYFAGNPVSPEQITLEGTGD